MRISKFQLKLTMIFLLVLLVPATAATFLTRYILTIERTGMDVDQKVEAVLQEASGIAYDIIDKAKGECQFVAEAISNHREIAAAFGFKEELRDLVSEIVPLPSSLSVVIFRGNPIEGKVIFSTSTGVESVPDTVINKFNQQRSSLSHQEGDKVFCFAPVFDNGKYIGAVLVYQQLDQELVRSIVDLQNLLSVYALREDLENLVWIGIIVLVVALAVTGTLFASLLARSVTKPILNLVDGMKEVGKGNLDYRVSARGKDEIATLVESFNSMTAQLKESRERLLVTERLAAWRDVARRIAHEIKNLLTPIQLSMYRLRKNLGSERYGQIFEESYASIIREVDNLRNMVTEFSNFARMPKPRLYPSSINEVIQDAINLYTGLPDSITIQTELSDNLPKALADRDQIRQVLHNLISNAVDAMPKGGRICVTTHLESDNLVSIKVSDTGYGMSEEVRKKLFTPYFTTKEKGTGLGMAISAQIIEEHGGQIFVDSQPNVGTEVTIKLPISAEDPVQATP